MRWARKFINEIEFIYKDKTVLSALVSVLFFAVGAAFFIGALVTAFFGSLGVIYAVGLITLEYNGWLTAIAVPLTSLLMAGAWWLGYNAAAVMDSCLQDLSNSGTRP